jgi:hypothetical protein
MSEGQKNAEIENKIKNKHFYNESLPVWFFLRTMTLENRARQDIPDLLLLTLTPPFIFVC